MALWAWGCEDELTASRRILAPKAATGLVNQFQGLSYFGESTIYEVWDRLGSKRKAEFRARKKLAGGGGRGWEAGGTYELFHGKASILVWHS